MKNIKDRKIRIINLPEGNIIFKVMSRFRHKLYVIIFFAGLLIFLKINPILIIAFLVLIYFVLSLQDKLIFEIRETYLVYYIDSEFAEIIYYDEIINYRVKKLEYSDVKLIVMTNDEQEYGYVLPDFKVIKEIDSVLGEKRVGK